MLAQLAPTRAVLPERSARVRQSSRPGAAAETRRASAPLARGRLSMSEPQPRPTAHERRRERSYASYTCYAQLRCCSHTTGSWSTQHPRSVSYSNVVV